MGYTLNSHGLEPYKQLHGADINHAWFICEGRYLVEDAIKATRQGHLHMISLLCDSRQTEEWKTKKPSETQLIALDPDELNNLVGFNFHRGVICCCALPDAPSEDTIIQSRLLLVLPHIDNVDNLGQLLRTAAALGIDAILCGKGPNHFSRRCLRVSMGAAWKIPILSTDNPVQILDAWLWHFPDIKSEIIGTANTIDAESAWQWQPAQRSALVLGSESQGLDSFWRQKCTKQVRIPMARKIDSLNVSIAGAILMGKLVD